MLNPQCVDLQIFSEKHLKMSLQKCIANTKVVIKKILVRNIFC